MAGAVRFSTDELATLASRIAEARRAGAGAGKSAVRRDDGAGAGACASACRPSPARWRCSMCRWRWRNWRWRRAMCGPRIDNGLGFKIARGRHPVVEAALAAEHARGFVPNDCDLSPNAKGRLVAGHRPQHGGQIHLPAPECADRHPGPDGKLRAGGQRPYRHCRPAVLAASARATIWRRAAPPSWSRWWRPPPSSIRRRKRAW